MSRAAASRLERNFSRGSASYDAAAEFQDSAAEALASRVAEAVVSKGVRPLRLLELGCGSGLLTTRLLKALPQASLLAADLSPAMLAVCSSKLRPEIASGRLELRRCDFDELDPGFAAFDFAVSSMAFQWSSGLPALAAKLARSLRPEGELLFSIPLEGSLSELRGAFVSSGARFPGLELPSLETLKAAFSPGFARFETEFRRFEGREGSLLQCLRGLRDLGTLNEGRPMPVSALRGVLRAKGGEPMALNYEYALCRCRKA